MLRCKHSFHAAHTRASVVGFVMIFTLIFSSAAFAEQPSESSEAPRDVVFVSGQAEDSLPESAGANPQAVTLDELLTQAEGRLATIETVELIVRLEQYSPADGSVSPGKGRLTARMPDVFRFDWMEPDMMAGSILLVDKGNNEAQQYNPIREEIIIQRWDRLAEQQNLGPEIDRWLAVPSPDDFYLEMGESEIVDERMLFVVLARPREAPDILYEFLIDPDSWLVSMFRQYDRDDRLMLRGSLSDVRINGDISAERLTEMPPYARIRRR